MILAEGGAAGITTPSEPRQPVCTKTYTVSSDQVLLLNGVVANSGKNVLVFRGFWNLKLWIKKWGPGFSSFGAWLKNPFLDGPALGRTKERGKAEHLLCTDCVPRTHQSPLSM